MVDVMRLRQLQFPPLEAHSGSTTETEWYEISDDQPDITHRLPGSAKAKSKSVAAPKAKAKAFPVQPHFDENRKCHPTCRNTTALGSTVYASMITCKDCGFRTITPRAETTGDPRTCRHLNVDHRGSTRAEKKFYCKDCGFTTTMTRAE